jgi:putative nucleotidyltransferase-like protein
VDLKNLRADSPPIPELLATAASLRMDALAAQTKAQFDARGIEAILLKGPSFARWLYEGGPARLYTDVDFLVSPDNWGPAREMLIELGYEAEFTHFEHPQMGTVTSEGWMRGDDQVDLHCTLWGISADPSIVWATLSQTAEPMAIGGSVLSVLSEPARTMHVALHAAQHGDSEIKTKTDLERAIAVLPSDTWRQGAELAESLGALPEFATGLRQVPAGGEVAAHLGLDQLTSADAELRAAQTPLASGFEHLAQTPGVLAKLRVLKSELFPTASFLRWWLPIAKYGKAGLAAAYVWRWLWMARHGIPGFRAWRRARREAARSARRSPAVAQRP